MSFTNSISLCIPCWSLIEIYYYEIYVNFHSYYLKCSDYVGITMNKRVCFTIVSYDLKSPIARQVRFKDWFLFLVGLTKTSSQPASLLTSNPLGGHGSGPFDRVISQDKSVNCLYRQVAHSIPDYWSCWEVFVCLQRGLLNGFCF